MIRVFFDTKGATSATLANQCHPAPTTQPATTAAMQGADVVENFLPKQSCLRFLNTSKRHLNTFKLLLTFTKNFEGP